MTDHDDIARWYNARAHDPDVPLRLLCSDPVSGESSEKWEAEAAADARALSNMLFQIQGNNLTVMDYGCGCGRIAKPLVGCAAGKIGQLLMVDVAPEVLRRAQVRCGLDSPFRYYLTRPLDPPETIPDGSVDFAYCDYVLQHLDQHHAVLLLKSIRRKLKPDGLLWFFLPRWNPVSFVNSAAELRKPEIAAKRMRHWTWEILSKTLLQLDYSIVAAHPESIQVLARPGPATDWLRGYYRER